MIITSIEGQKVQKITAENSCDKHGNFPESNAYGENISNSCEDILDHNKEYVEEILVFDFDGMASGSIYIVFKDNVQKDMIPYKVAHSLAYTSPDEMDFLDPKEIEPFDPTRKILRVWWD